MHFLNLPATSCCSTIGFFIFALVTLSNPSYCGLHDGTFVSPTGQEQFSLPSFDREIPGWRTVTSVSGWKLSIRSSWDVLGPFPQHAREQHFLSPSFPFRSTSVMLHRRFVLIVRHQDEDCIEVRTDTRFPSYLADGGFVTWANTKSDDEGRLAVSFPNIR